MPASKQLYDRRKINSLLLTLGQQRAIIFLGGENRGTKFLWSSLKADQ